MIDDSIWEYKGYQFNQDNIEFSKEYLLSYGRIYLLDGDVITFQTSLNNQDLKNEFELSMDDYLEWCEDDGVEPCEQEII